MTPTGHRFPRPRPPLPYTVRARRFLEEAQKAAFERAQPAYDQEDILVGMAPVPESAGLEVLRRLGVSQERLRAEADALLAYAPAAGQAPPVNVHVSSVFVRPSPRAQALLALAGDESRSLGHYWVGVEHLLLAMLRQSSGPGHDALARLRVQLEPARAALRAYLLEASQRS